MYRSYASCKLGLELECEEMVGWSSGTAETGAGHLEERGARRSPCVLGRMLQVVAAAVLVVVSECAGAMAVVVVVVVCVSFCDGRNSSCLER